MDLINRRTGKDATKPRALGLWGTVRIGFEFHFGFVFVLYCVLFALVLWGFCGGLFFFGGGGMLLLSFVY